MRAMHRLPRAMPFQQVRRFHQTRSAPFLNEALDAASGIVYGVHSASHLPWALSIPLTAFLVRMGVAFPLQIFYKVQARRDTDLAPILQAWRHHYQRQVHQISANESISRAQAMRMVPERGTKKYVELRRRWGVIRHWKGLPWLQIPFWIAMMESVRAMSGMSQGLVPYLLSLSQGSAETIKLAVEPTLATEGALWFPDLLAGDPTGVLPVVLTASILLNVQNGWKVPALKEIADMPRKDMWSKLRWRALRLGIQILACNLGLSAYMTGMPTALLIYWITSTNIATLQTSFLDKYMFPSPAVKPRKPVYIGYPRARKEKI
ncbi:putative mitochondrial export translocase Oxa2 [Aspergillus undulatus]|uniref:putative mitochondrial export translocase Oxa2 n=1 Tax=Aspergillus undulatus TaxID=1810928 RepID=UPI003CCDA268